MKVAQAMKEQGLRYFSSLTPKQKNETVNYIIKVKFGLHELNDGLAKVIINTYPLEKIIEARSFIHENIKNQKMFLHNGLRMPLNIQKLI